MRNRISLTLFVLICSLSRIHAENGAPQGSMPRDGSYLIPQTVYVGDQGRLVIPLGAANSEIEAQVLSGKNTLPSSAELMVTRLEIEKKAGAARLLVDFRAYAPGLIHLPVLKIGPHEFSGLNVNISSILEAEGGGNMVLSDAEGPLAVPGTVFIVYGSIIGIIIFLFLIIFTGVWGVPYLRSARKWRSRKIVLRSLQRSLQKARYSINKNGVFPGAEGAMLAGLSRDFRRFLSFFTHENCLTMVPGEFLGLPRKIRADELFGGETCIVEHTRDLYQLFRQCDELRFSGIAFGAEKIVSIIDEISDFADAFESLEKAGMQQKDRETTLPAKGAAQ